MFRGHSDEESFHRKATISQGMQLRRQQMSAEINRLAEVKLKAVPVEQLAQEIAGRFSITIPVFDEGAIRPAMREVDVDFAPDP